MSNLEKVILVLLIMTISSACNRSYYHQHCGALLDVQAGMTKMDDIEIPSFVTDLVFQVDPMLSLGGDRQIFLTETFDGGNGEFEAVLVSFNDTIINLVLIDYIFVDRKVQLVKSRTIDGKKRKISKLKKLFVSTIQNGPNCCFVDCFSSTVESKIVFYLKKNEDYLFFSLLKNYDFSLNPIIGIDEELLELIKILRKFQDKNAV